MTADDGRRLAGDELTRGPDLPQLADRVGGQVLLADVGDRPAGGGVGGQVFGVVRGAEDHRDVRVPGDDAAGGLDAVHLRHVDVHQHERRVQQVDEVDRLWTA